MKHMFNDMTGVVTNNISTMMEQMEDPEQMVLQLIRDMEESFFMARETAEEAMASERKLARQLKQTKNNIANWQHRAENSRIIDNVDMEHKALFRKKELEMAAGVLQERLDSAATTSHGLKQELHLMESELEDIRQRALDLDIRQRAA